MNIELTKEEIQNLLVFLTRTQLNGNEVQAFNQLALKLKGALQSEEPKDKKK